MQNMKNFVHVGMALAGIFYQLDFKIYANFKLFRTFMSTKLGQNQPFIYQSDTFISSSSTNVLREKDIFILLLISYPQCSLPLLRFRSSSESVIHLINYFTNDQFIISQNTYPSPLSFQSQLIFDSISPSSSQTLLLAIKNKFYSHYRFRVSIPFS